MLIHNCLLPDGQIGYIIVTSDEIASVGHGPCPGLILDTYGRDRVVDCHGAMVMPGAIDIHVHFRQPGLTHKATIATESHAALAGGVTSFVDMPNTVPQTVAAQFVEEKMSIAARDSVVNYGFFIGATKDNIDILPYVDYTRVAGVKLFMGSSTGGMLLGDDRDISRLFESVPKNVVVVVHAEDNDVIDRCRADVVSRYGDDPPVRFHSAIRPGEACVRATERALNLASRYGTRLHVAHISTADELSLFSPGDIADKQFTCEVSPHHLLWTVDDYATRGPRIKMNPSVKTIADCRALRRAVETSRVDVIATDHAPHLAVEKQGGALRALSGAPMVQFSVPAMLDMFDAATVARTMAANPAALLGIDRRGTLAKGMFADIIMVRDVEPYPVEDSDVVSLCRWTPLAPDPALRREDTAPFTLTHRVTTLAVNGADMTPRPLSFYSGAC